MPCGTCLGREPKTKPWYGFGVLGLTLTWVHFLFPDKSGPTKARRCCLIDRSAQKLGSSMYLRFFHKAGLEHQLLPIHTAIHVMITFNQFDIGNARTHFDHH